jgi:hypothetical protein
MGSVVCFANQGSGFALLILHAIHKEGEITWVQRGANWTRLPACGSEIRQPLQGLAVPFDHASCRLTGIWRSRVFFGLMPRLNPRLVMGIIVWFRFFFYLDCLFPASRNGGSDSQ